MGNAVARGSRRTGRGALLAAVFAAGTIVWGGPLSWGQDGTGAAGSGGATHLEQARALLKAGRAQDALAEARKALEAEASADADVMVGEALLAVTDDNAAEAAIHFDSALTLEPRNVGAKVGVARVKAVQGDYEGAVAVLEEAAQLNPRPEEVYYHLGLVHERAGKFEEAVGAYRFALERLLQE